MIYHTKYSSHMFFYKWILIQSIKHTKRSEAKRNYPKHGQLIAQSRINLLTNPRHDQKSVGEWRVIIFITHPASEKDCLA